MGGHGADGVIELRGVVPEEAPDPGEVALAAIRAVGKVLEGMPFAEAAQTVDLGDGVCCCQRATGPLCLEHEQLAAALQDVYAGVD
jgi:hypothetical protein